MQIKRVKKHFVNSKRMSGTPQKKGVIVRVYATNPRKPNSAQRKVAKVLVQKKMNILTAIKGVPHSLKKFSKVWLEGVGFRDTPFISTKLIPNKEAFTFSIFKKKRRSIYGLKKSLCDLF
jgi:small subunit ribosomal protein S12